MAPRPWTLTVLASLASPFGCAGQDPAGADTDATTGCAGSNCAPASSSGEIGDDDTGSGDAIPCDVQEILAEHCWSCHGSTPLFGAPMPLVTLADLRVPAKTDPSRTVAELVADRLVDEQRPMPPTDDLDDADRSAVLDWIGAGAPASPEQCDVPDPDTGTDTGDTGEPVVPCESQAVFTAHGGSEGSRFDVPLVDDLYQCFTFESPFSGDEHGVGWTPIIDDARVVHHWLLLRSPEGTVPGQSGPCGDPFGGAGELLMGWAPGAASFTFPDDVGLELPGPGEVLTLQIHYNNIGDLTDASDASGVALCTEPAREHTAASIWLGTLNIDIPPETLGHTTAGECDTSNLAEPVYMLSSWPHMHEHGEALRTEILRGGDASEPELLVGVDGWNFNNQIYHPHTPPVRVDPGDVLRTTCTFDNPGSQPVSVGEGTGDEMCFNFAMVYPIDVFGDGQRRKCGLL